MQLPTERSIVENYDPKMLVIFGKPKAGKSTFISAIPDNLVLDLEDGYRALSVMKVLINRAEDLYEVKDAIIAKGREIKKKPYKYITIDNATRLEELALPIAADLYRATPMGASWGNLTDAKGMPIRNPKTGKFEKDPKADVRQLPSGAGYTYTRKALRTLIDMFRPLCDTLILVCHVKDRQIRVNGTELSELSVDLAGKTGDIICGEADAIGLVYREGNKTILSFEGGDNTVKEARCPHLRGKKFIVAESDESNNINVNVSEIFISNNTNKD